MDNVIERIVEICKEKKIPVSKLEKDLGYGNGYLNPKKVSDIKASRLFEILDYLDISSEEFFNVGSQKFQATSNVLSKLKKVNPEFYDYIFSLDPNSSDKKAATNSDGFMEFLDLSQMSDDQRIAIEELQKLNPHFQSLARGLIESLLSSQQAADNQ